MQAVIFDLYETLITHFDPGWVPPDRTIAERLGMSDSRRSELWPEIDFAWQSGQIGSYDEALAQLCAVAGAKPDAAVIAELVAEVRATKGRLFEADEPEIFEMVSALKRSGLKLGVITNATDLDAEPWPRCHFAPMFDSFIASHEVGLLKPNRKIYELSCAQLGIDPGDAMFVGDGGSNELHGARAVGMTAYWCTWFLERWPEGITPNGFKGGEWREKSYKGELPFPQLNTPNDLVEALL